MSRLAAGNEVFRAFHGEIRSHDRNEDRRGLEPAHLRYERSEQHDREGCGDERPGDGGEHAGERQSEWHTRNELVTKTPAVPPMNSDGNIGPPMNPLAWLTAKVKIFAITMAASRPAPSMLASLSTVLSWALPVKSVSGSATPTTPNSTPPSVDRAMSESWRTSAPPVP